MPWSRQFDLPIPGMPTLRHAATYVTKLPKSEQNQPHWQLAAEMLLKASKHDAYVLLAGMAMMKALNFGKPEKPREPRRKAVRVATIVNR